MRYGTTTSACAAVIRRDLLLTWRRRGDALNPALFAIMVVVMFPLALGPEPNQLANISVGIVFVAVLLAGLLALDTLFRGDHEDGTLEQIVLSPHPLSLLLGSKILVHWLSTALPLIVISPALAEMLHLPRAVMPVLIVALTLATLLLSLLGAVCVALTIGMRRSGMLLALLVLPLYVPVLVFGAGAVAATAQGLDAVGALLLLGAGLVLSLVLGPPVAAAALRIAHA